jgi:hypothetical protein
MFFACLAFVLLPFCLPFEIFDRIILCLDPALMDLYKSHAKHFTGIRAVVCFGGLVFGKMIGKKARQEQSEN